MTLNDVLLSLLDSAAAGGEAQIITWDAVQHWPADALDRMGGTGILTLATPAQSIECQGCENRCFMEVQHLSGKGNSPRRAFVVCDHPEMQSQMGRIQISQERLQQWKVTALQLANVVACLLSIESKAVDRHGQTNIPIGMIKGKNGRRWVSLNKSPLTLEVGDHHLSLDEVLYFENDTLKIDQQSIKRLIDKAPRSDGKKYVSSTKKQEARKRNTEAKYQDWRDEYRKLRRQYPDHSDSWIARKISNMKIAKGLSSEHIRKKMLT